MQSGACWMLGHAEVSYRLFQRLLLGDDPRCQPQPHRALLLSLEQEDSISSPHDDGATELPSCVVQVFPSTHSAPATNETGEQPEEVVFLHPFLADFLSQAASLLQQHDNNLSSQTNDDGVRVSLAPMPALDVSFPLLFDNNITSSFPARWTAKGVKVEELPRGATIQLTCVYVEGCYDDKRNLEEITTFLSDNSALCRSLRGRLVRKGTVIALSILHGACVVVAAIDDVLDSNGDTLDHRQLVYQVGMPDDLRVESSVPSSVLACWTKQQSIPLPVDSGTNNDWEKECPGYENVVNELLELLCLPHVAVAPSGILLTGPSGVGKSRLSSCVAAKLAKGGDWSIRCVSVHDLLVQASFATSDDLYNLLLPTGEEGGAMSRTLLIIDDMLLLGDDDTEDFDRGDVERRMVSSSLVQIVDRVVAQNVSIMGIASNSSQLPSALKKANRLEKEISMLPPSESQREKIMVHILRQANVDLPFAQIWAASLAPVMAGCVASDICRVVADALTSVCARTSDSLAPPEWEDMREAVRRCVPSQLAALDVTKPPSFWDYANCSGDDWYRIHELSWHCFAGYDLIKKRVYQTVVLPWRLHLKADGEAEASDGKAIIYPPSGVLFHGESGCGKTLAAQCLGASLGLPMIKVRTADILDKWLGGSETAVRSLFARARAASPCILFFDEIDSIASNRADGEESSGGVMSRVLSTLLNEMDGVSSGCAAIVLVIACTNRLEALDAALLRPGRLDEHILLEKPTKDDVFRILDANLSRVPIPESVDLESIAEVLSLNEVSSADVEGVAREAVVRSLRRASNSSHVSVANTDFEDAQRALKIL